MPPTDPKLIAALALRAALREYDTWHERTDDIGTPLPGPRQPGNRIDTPEAASRGLADAAEQMLCQFLGGELHAAERAAFRTALAASVPFDTDERI